VKNRNKERSFVMLKRVLAFSIVGAGLAILLPVSDAPAHLSGYKKLDGSWRHISSYDCTGAFAKVPSLDQHPALFQCQAVVDSFDFLCANPEGKLTGPDGYVRGNSGPRTVELFAQDVVNEENLTEKVKGAAIKTLLMPDAVLEAATEECSNRNKTWFASDELILSVKVRLKTYSCLDDACTETEQASEQLLDCLLPPEYDIVDNPPPGGGTPTPYDCYLIEEAHCDKGDTCPIPY